MAAAAPSDKVKDKEYKNWLKVTLALYYMKSGLHKFIQTEVNCLHESLKQAIYGGHEVLLQPCSMCNDKLLKRNKHTGVWTFQNQCKSYCDVWLQKLLTLHVNNKSERIYWNNCNIPSWPFKPWECAKVFMPRGQPPSNDGPAECDAQALMTLLTNCKHFHQKLSPNGQALTSTISTIRNSVMHAGEMKLSDGDRKRFIQEIIQFLEDPVSLKSIEDCKTAVGNIHKIDNDSMDIFFNVELHIIALMAAVNDVRQELGIQEKKSFENIASLEKEYIRLREKMTRSFDDVRKDVGDAMNTIKNNVEALNKRTDSAQQQQEMLSESMNISSKRVDEHDKRIGIVEGNVAKLQEVIGHGQRKYSCGGKAMPWRLKVEDLIKVWKSIEDFLLEELAPKHMLPYFERGRFLSVEESRDMCQLPRSEVVKNLLQRIRANLPDGFVCLLYALDETEQEVIVKQLEVKIKETLNQQPVTHNPETCGKERSAVQDAKGKEQSAVKPGEEGIVMKVEVLKGGKQLHRTESSVGNDVKGRIVLDYDMNSVCLKFESGSVIIYLKPLSKHAKETLPFFCQHGGMKNFVLDLLKKKDIFSSLPEGEICIRIQVCYNKDVAFEDARDFTRMVEDDPLSRPDSFTVTQNLHVIKQNLLLQYGNMLEEIEPLQFLDTFVNIGILDNSFFENLKMIERRRARAAQFLNQIMNEGNTAFVALVYALRNSGNDVLANRLCTVRNISSEFSSEGQLDDSCIEVVQEDSKTHAEVDFRWSCSLTIVVKKNEDGDFMIFKDHTGKLKISNVEIQDIIVVLKGAVAKNLTEVTENGGISGSGLTDVAELEAVLAEMENHRHCTDNKQYRFTISRENKDYTVVAAIDFGTTYSNWAYSFIDDYKNDPLKIRCRTWNDSQNMSMKAPTTILVREDGKTLDKFGYEAEEKYAQFAAEDAKELHLWYYFRRFKMLLHHRNIRRDMMLESENGKVLPALRVFALTIEYLKNDLLENLSQMTMDDVDQSLIRWVLTVPAIWNESAKQFMREAAVTAGIPSNQLNLALEPEVASLYCSKIPLSTYNGETCPLLPGAKFILIDAGGGTIDIIAHEVMSDGSLNEIYRSNGGAWGGTEVDKAFFDFLNDFFGRSVHENFKQKHMEDYLYLCRDFEQKKRTVEPKISSKIIIRVPGSLNKLFEKQDEQHLAASLKSRGQWSERVELVSDKMRLEADIMKRFFADVLQKTRDHLQLLFSNDSMNNVNIIMMVGGFSESKMLQEMVINLFPKKKVIIPTQAGLAVLKGAVLFGHDPAVIGHRVCRFSYGVKTSVKFVKSVHREDKRKTVGNEDLCVDIFDIHVHKGQSVKLNAKQIPMVYKPQKPGQKNISFEFYSSNECNPMYVTDEGCSKLGKITVYVLEDSRMENAVEVSFKFGGTEIQVEARDKKTGKATKTKIDFI